MDNRAGLDPAAAARIEAITAKHRILADVLQWGLVHRPPLVVADVITQDEYTHDVVVPYVDGLFLVYDTT
jgi:hypothetical protein